VLTNIAKGAFMAYSVEDINNIKQAIALGARVVEYSDRKVEYRSLDDMKRTLAMMEKEVFGTQSTSSLPRRVPVVFGKGLL